MQADCLLVEPFIIKLNQDFDIHYILQKGTIKLSIYMYK
jgi:hypothetical protein